MFSFGEGGHTWQGSQVRLLALLLWSPGSKIRRRPSTHWLEALGFRAPVAVCIQAGTEEKCGQEAQQGGLAQPSPTPPQLAQGLQESNVSHSLPSPEVQCSILWVMIFPLIIHKSVVLYILHTQRHTTAEPHKCSMLLFKMMTVAVAFVCSFKPRWKKELWGSLST